MSNDWKPLDGGRDGFEGAVGLSKLLQGIDSAKTREEIEKNRKLLEEQVRLQKEALELEKKKLALEEAKLRQGQAGQQGYSPPASTTSPATSPISSWEESDDDDDDDDDEPWDGATDADKVWYHNCRGWRDRIARILNEEQAEERLQKAFRAIGDKLGEEYCTDGELDTFTKMNLVGWGVEFNYSVRDIMKEADEARRQEMVRKIDEECAKRHVRLTEEEKQRILSGTWFQQDDDEW